MEFTYRTEIVCITADGVERKRATELTSEQVGAKAHGLLGVPQSWVPDFFCIAADAQLSSETLAKAAALAGMQLDEPVYVRSSGSLEGIEQRGSLISSQSTLREVPRILSEMRAKMADIEGASRQSIHALVQRRVPTRAKGHLSNERRVSRVARDWLAEIEPSQGHEAESHPVAVRNWRSTGGRGSSLHCTLRAQIFRTLREVAAWAGPRRLHMEWVWDGGQLWVVQCEDALDADGVKPKELVKLPAAFDSNALQGLVHFRRATPSDFEAYRKLKNASLYVQLGYELPPFYVLDDHHLLDSIQNGADIPGSLRADLVMLTKGPLILRTDGKSIPNEKREMLPRSDELRDEPKATEWLRSALSEALAEIPCEASELALIGHHFLPAVASAWALAEPEKRRVRIESLWGIPEGIYYYSHDVFDVDVARVGADKGDLAGIQGISRRIRYKDQFIAPDHAGSWIVHKVAPPADWSPSIASDEALKEIANTTRLIAENEGSPAVVMWFVGLAGSSSDSVLPWWHDVWNVELPAERPLGKTERIGSTFTVANALDLQTLEADANGAANYKRVAVKPESSEIVRDRGFIDRLAVLAKNRGYVVELRGGVLSHVYYTLRRHNCDVVCVDDFATTDERLEFNKIVRDKIPDLIASRGERTDVARVEGDVLLQGLRQKLVEESLEVVDAKSLEAISEELADVLEVVKAIEDTLGVKRSEIERIRQAKAEKRGGFSQGIVLRETSLAPPMAGALLGNSTERFPPLEPSVIPTLPTTIRAINVDRRTQGPQEERIVTFAFPIVQQDYRFSRGVFDLQTLSGESHPMRLEAEVSRSGAELRVRFKLANNAIQMDLFEKAKADPANDEDTAPAAD
ncbi:MAG: hypothetical protein ACREPD_14190 [Stenotrophomonas sp.]|uniref:hypothetical protein n=1 Tax=Gammaproteobacteria TaxID=1236 RepID=UPI003D6CD647